MAAGFLTGLLAAALAAAEITHVEALGELSVPSTAMRGVQVGGLSGLTWDPVGRRYWAISDDRAERGAVRVYRLRIEVVDGALSEVEVEDFIELRLADGAGFGSGRVDPEGVAWMKDGSFLVSSEGVVQWEVPPFLRIFGADGIERRALPLPPRYAARRDRQSGVRDNLGLESAAVSPDGRWGFAAVESALIQDAKPPSSGEPSPTRILRFDLERGRLDAELVYWIDPLQRAPAAARINVSGVVDLIAMDSERLLVLERAFATGVGTRVRIYESSLTGADDVQEVASLAGRLGGLRAAEKSLVLDVGELGVVPDNLEGMTFGPDLPDGRRLLLLLADDNFAVPLQRSQLLAYAVDRRPLAIHAVQGSGHRSPFEGDWVRGVEGVVTGVVEAAEGRTGFWMETPSGGRDEDARSSEGIFVLGADAVTPSVGDLVRVQGAVRESGSAPELTTTRLVGGSVTLVRAETVLPAPVLTLAASPLPPVVDDDDFGRFEPQHDAVDRLESVEGMRVLVPPSRVVGSTQRFGEIAVFPGEGGGGLEATVAGGLLLPPSGATPGPLLLGGRLAPTPAVAVGDLLPELVAVVDYAWGKYVLEVLRWPAATPGRRPSPELPFVEEGLTLATFNVRNLAPTDPPARITALATQVVAALGSPDVLALQEIQDDSGPVDDGTVTAAVTLRLLTDAIRSVGGPAYTWRQLDPIDGREGGQPGGNIRVAYLFNAERVDFPADSLERLGAGDPAFEGRAQGPTKGGRPCLAGTIRFGPEDLRLVNCHLQSKLGDDPLYGENVPPRRRTEGRRLAQVGVVGRWAEERLEADPHARLVVLGDLNETEHRAPLVRLAAAGLENLTLAVPRNRRYTFNHQGFSQLLDHVLVSPALAPGAAARVIHINADFPAARRASDHDPILVRLCPAGGCSERRPR